MSTGTTATPETSKTPPAAPATITEHEAQQVERANATGSSPHFSHALVASRRPALPPCRHSLQVAKLAWIQGARRSDG